MKLDKRLEVKGLALGGGIDSSGRQPPTDPCSSSVVPSVFLLSWTVPPSTVAVPCESKLLRLFRPFRLLFTRTLARFGPVTASEPVRFGSIPRSIDLVEGQGSNGILRNRAHRLGVWDRGQGGIKGKDLRLHYGGQYLGLIAVNSDDQFHYQSIDSCKLWKGQIRGSRGRCREWRCPELSISTQFSGTRCFGVLYISLAYGSTKGCSASSSTPSRFTALSSGPAPAPA
ncbi:hypothetical protein SODALDRAFT_357303 [Sodiomyces alkalinus F11]|uniref:Uncharacterized protein n=1 Tax=Sodiomyces alkalinus (strain CBS 110278 / VKM F-3762 / F11) TaxID=1314773 RepID=A0A3N2Q3D5_SODAK|nr:hypothetical protein SODALDRAFT_357303 [Sodiomyces alkalinus F11]ROT41270.1 hypothetical protein SODALDRAFT_357303 [Sodiomyces alkalinus F11]